MVELTLEQAQLLRVLHALFGRDRIVCKVSVNLVCDGALPAEFLGNGEALQSWAKHYKCLFTVLNEAGSPKLVVEFNHEFEEALDVQNFEFKPLLEPILKAKQVHYVSISRKEFDALLQGADTLEFVRLLGTKITFDDPQLSF